MYPLQKNVKHLVSDIAHCFLPATKLTRLLRHPYAWFTLSSKALIETFGEMWMRRGTHECRHSHSWARATRQTWNILISCWLDWFTNMSPRASRWDVNRLRVWEMRRMHPSHSRSRRVLCSLNKNVNQALINLRMISLHNRCKSVVFTPVVNKIGCRLRWCDS